MLYQTMYTPQPYVPVYYRYERTRGRLVMPGDISRNRSRIRIKTLSLGKSPGAALVEKFIIKEKKDDKFAVGGALGAGGRPARFINNTNTVSGAASSNPVIVNDRSVNEQRYKSAFDGVREENVSFDLTKSEIREFPKRIEEEAEREKPQSVEVGVEKEIERDKVREEVETSLHSSENDKINENEQVESRSQEEAVKAAEDKEEKVKDKFSSGTNFEKKKDEESEVKSENNENIIEKNITTLDLDEAKLESKSDVNVEVKDKEQTLESGKNNSNQNKSKLLTKKDKQKNLVSKKPKSISTTINKDEITIKSAQEDCDSQTSKFELTLVLEKSKETTESERSLRNGEKPDSKLKVSQEVSKKTAESKVIPENQGKVDTKLKLNQEEPKSGLEKQAEVSESKKLPANQDKPDTKLKVSQQKPTLGLEKPSEVAEPKKLPENQEKVDTKLQVSQEKLDKLTTEKQQLGLEKPTEFSEPEKSLANQDKLDKKLKVSQEKSDTKLKVSQEKPTEAAEPKKLPANQEKLDIKLKVSQVKLDNKLKLSQEKPDTKLKVTTEKQKLGLEKPTEFSEPEKSLANQDKLDNKLKVSQEKSDTKLKVSQEKPTEVAEPKKLPANQEKLDIKFKVSQEKSKLKLEKPSDIAEPKKPAANQGKLETKLKVSQEKPKLELEKPAEVAELTKLPENREKLDNKSRVSQETQKETTEPENSTPTQAKSDSKLKVCQEKPKSVLENQKQTSESETLPTSLDNKLKKSQEQTSKVLTAKSIENCVNENSSNEIKEKNNLKSLSDVKAKKLTEDNKQESKSISQEKSKSGLTFDQDSKFDKKTETGESDKKIKKKKLKSETSTEKNLNPKKVKRKSENKDKTEKENVDNSGGLTKYKTVQDLTENEERPTREYFRINLDKENNSVVCTDDDSELDSNNNFDSDWEEVEIEEMDENRIVRKKKVLLKKKGSKIKVKPLETKPPSATLEVSSPGEITRNVSQRRLSIVDADLCCLLERKTSITDDIIVQEAAYLDTMIKEELRDRRKSSLGFPAIPEEIAKPPSPIAEEPPSAPPPPPREPSPPPTPTHDDRRAAWKAHAVKQPEKSLGKFYKPQVREESSSDEEECDVNCHRKCQWLTPNLCGVNQKLMAEALARLKVKERGASSSTSSGSRHPCDGVSMITNSSECSDSSSDTTTVVGRVSPPAKTLPRFRTYSIQDFQFLKVLGKGSFGKVLLAELKGSECYYAVKCLKKDVVLEDDDVECTLIERKVLALATGHPYFSHLFCTFQTESHLFFVMEYLNGGDLMFHIQQSGRFDEGRARFYAAEIVSGLSFLHKWGIVYRDLKLDNVLLDFDGHVRIADFGMCKLQIYLDKTTDTFCGTPDYMAPEIIKGLKYNQCVDWWSFGILLYELLVGQSPFSGCDEDDLFWSICNARPHMPSYLSAPAKSILLALMEKDWTKRLGSSENGSADVMNHAFFNGLKWHLLERKLIEPPFKPTMKHPLDTKYFDKVFTSEKPVLTPVDKTILESMDQSQFQGFSYTNPNATE